MGGQGPLARLTCTWQPGRRLYELRFRFGRRRPAAGPARPGRLSPAPGGALAALPAACPFPPPPLCLLKVITHTHEKGFEVLIP